MNEKVDTLKKQHILLLPSWYPKNTESISGSFFREQAIALQKRGVKVGVIYPQITPIKKGSRKFGFEKVIDCGVLTYRYHYFNITPRLELLIRIIWVRIGLYLFSKYVNDNGLPDLIHVHSSVNAGFLALLIKKKFGIKFVITEHSSYFITKKISKITLKNLEPIFENAEQCISVSHYLKDEMEKIFNTCDWKYLPNMVNDEFYLPSRHHLVNRKNNQEFIFLSVSSVDRNKNIELLINAFSISNINNSKLLIVGEGPELCNLKKLVIALGLTKNIIFLGSLKRNELKDIFEISDVLVSSSNFETFGVVLIEALAAGKPVISTRSGGPDSIIKNGVGLLVKKNSAESLSKAMRYIYENYSNYDYKYIKNYSKINFSEDVIVKNLLAIYNDC